MNSKDGGPEVRTGNDENNFFACKHDRNKIPGNDVHENGQLIDTHLQLSKDNIAPCEWKSEIRDGGHQARNIFDKTCAENIIEIHMLVPCFRERVTEKNGTKENIASCVRMSEFLDGER